MYEHFGAVVKESSIEFNLFFPDIAEDPGQYIRGGTPHIRTLRVTGDFQGQLGDSPWDVEKAPILLRQKHSKGCLYNLQVPKFSDGFYQYKYFVEFENGETRWCGDPCAKYCGLHFDNSAFVVGEEGAAEPIAHRLPLEDLILYELMIDDFTNGFRGNRPPLDAIRDKLDYLQQDLGINAIAFMPWTGWPGGGFSWGYDPSELFAVAPRYYGDPALGSTKPHPLYVLINELHKRNIQVIMDGVFNHVQCQPKSQGFPYYWLYQNTADSPFVGLFGEDKIRFFEDLDYRNECTAQFIADVCKYWLGARRIDGIRFDYALGFYQRSVPPVGISRLIRDLNHYLAEKEDLKRIALILEFLPDNRYEAVDKTNEIGATGCWYDQFLWDGNNAAASGHLKASFIRAINTGKDFGPGRFPVTYMENHDHSTAMEMCGGRHQWWRTQPQAIALFTCCGAPMLHNGQEFGDAYKLPEEGDGRVVPRPLHWEELSTDEVGGWLFGFYQKLISIRKAHPALRTPNFYPEPYDERWTGFNPEGYGVDEDRDVAIYHRWGHDGEGRLERFIIVLNFSAFDQRIDIPFSCNGDWEDLLNGGMARVKDYWLRNQTLSSHWGRIYFQLEPPGSSISIRSQLSGTLSSSTTGVPRISAQ